MPSRASIIISVEACTQMITLMHRMLRKRPKRQLMIYKRRVK